MLIVPADAAANTARVVMWMFLQCSIIGCSHGHRDRTVMQSSAVQCQHANPSLVVWWRDDTHHQHAGYRLYFCAWDDGVVLSAPDQPGIDIEAYALEPTTIEHLLARITEVRFFDRPPLFRIDQWGFYVIAAKTSGGSAVHVLDTRIVRPLADDPPYYDQYSQLWGDVLEAISAMDLPSDRRFELPKSFRGYSRERRRADWMSTSLFREDQ